MTLRPDRNGLLPALAIGSAVLLMTAVLTTHLPRLRAAGAGAPGTGTSPDAGAPAVRAVADYTALPAWNLLGAPPAVPGAAAQPPARPTNDTRDPGALPAASVRFTLRGVAYSQDERRARAIVALADGTQKRYRVGESPEAGFTIERITPRELVVRHAGRLERVALERPQERAGAPQLPPGPGALPGFPPPDSPQPEPALPETPPVPPEALPPGPPES